MAPRLYPDGRQGPMHEVRHVCEGCRYLTGNPLEQYKLYTCTHPKAPTVEGPCAVSLKGYIGNQDVTPVWCPCFKEHLDG